MVYRSQPRLFSNTNGQSSEIVSAHVAKIICLQEVRGANPAQVQQLNFDLRGLTSSSTRDNGQTSIHQWLHPNYPRLTVVRDDENWMQRNFPDLVGCATPLDGTKSS